MSLTLESGETFSLSDLISNHEARPRKKPAAAKKAKAKSAPATAPPAKAIAKKNPTPTPPPQPKSKHTAASARQVNAVRVAQYNKKNGGKMLNDAEVEAIRAKADAEKKAVIIRNDYSAGGTPYPYIPEGADGSDYDNYMENTDDEELNLDDEEWEAHLKALWAKSKKAGDTTDTWAEARKKLYVDDEPEVEKPDPPAPDSPAPAKVLLKKPRPAPIPQPMEEDSDSDVSDPQDSVNSAPPPPKHGPSQDQLSSSSGEMSEATQVSDEHEKPILSDRVKGKKPAVLSRVRTSGQPPRKNDSGRGTPNPFLALFG